MGFFSWLTSDTKKSIASRYSVKRTKTVYLLQPNGGSPIQEDDYEGYGVFGGVDAYDWLAENNLPQSVIESYEGETRSLGIALDCGITYLEDKEGNLFACNDTAAHLVTHFKEASVTKLDNGTNTLLSLGDEVIKDTVSGLIEKGLLKWCSLTDTIKNPLKFSRRQSAKYETLPAANNCPDQGFFY